MAERIIKNQKVTADEEDVDRNKECGQKFGYLYNVTDLFILLQRLQIIINLIPRD